VGFAEVIAFLASSEASTTGIRNGWRSRQISQDNSESQGVKNDCETAISNEGTFGKDPSTMIQKGKLHEELKTWSETRNEEKAENKRKNKLMLI
jgi:hypothetical protein